jgi:hypothetical protein
MGVNTCVLAGTEGMAVNFGNSSWKYCSNISGCDLELGAVVRSRLNELVIGNSSRMLPASTASLDEWYKKVFPMLVICCLEKRSLISLSVSTSVMFRRALVICKRKGN